MLTSFLTRERTGIARNLPLGSDSSDFHVYVFFFHLEICLLEKVKPFPTFVQDLWMFSRLGRDTVQLGDSRYIHVTCSEHKSTSAVSQMGFGQHHRAGCRADMTILNSSNMIQNHWTKVFCNKHVVFTLCEILQNMTTKPLL